jgi:general secretion pathway protein J
MFTLLKNRFCFNLASKCNNQAGFTLIELLVALGISAVIAVLAHQSISAMVNVKSSVHEHSKDTEKLQRAIWLMEQDFVQIAPRAIMDELGSQQAAFKFRTDIGVEFTRIAQFPTPSATGGLLRVAYKLEDEVLYRLTWPVLDRAPNSVPRKQALLSDIAHFDVEMLSQNNEWTKDWPLPNQPLNALPKLTKVKIEHKQLGNISRLFMGVN